MKLIEAHKNFEPFSACMSAVSPQISLPLASPSSSSIWELWLQAKFDFMDCLDEGYSWIFNTDVVGDFWERWENDGTCDARWKLGERSREEVNYHLQLAIYFTVIHHIHTIVEGCGRYDLFMTMNLDSNDAQEWWYATSRQDSSSVCEAPEETSGADFFRLEVPRDDKLTQVDMSVDYKRYFQRISRQRSES